MPIARKTELIGSGVDEIIKGAVTEPSLEVWRDEVEESVGSGDLYPTVQRTIQLLNQLHLTLPSDRFDELAQEAIDASLSSLQTATTKLVALDVFDGTLFAIKNLVRLRDAVSSYDAKFKRMTSSLDLIDIVTALLGMTSFQGITKEIDMKMMLDERLKETCERFIFESLKLCCSEIIEGQKDFKMVRSKIKVRFDGIIAKINQYIGIRNTRMTLLRIIGAKIKALTAEYLAIEKSSGKLENQTEEIDDFIDGTLLLLK